jgi:squalene cyclase
VPGFDTLAERQNPDGGWSYHRGGSWTEPTCYALLALAALGAGQSAAARRGGVWLASRQRPDGGWAPRDSVDESTWVSALVLLLPPEIATVDRNRAVAWVLAQTGRESGWMYRLRQWMLGARAEVSQQFDGWPWYPGAAAWVAPTALTVLALEKSNRAADPRIHERLEQGREFLLARRCPDGGWNHGSTRALGYDSGSYPETTGVALLALHSSRKPEIESGVSSAERQLAACRSTEAASWLQLGLLARGRPAPAPAVDPQGGVLEMALGTLAQAASQGRNLFLA